MIAQESRWIKWGSALIVIIVLTLACGIPTTPSEPQAPAFDATKAVLELQATQMSMQLTQQALQNTQPQQPLQPTPQQPVVQPTPAPPTQEPAPEPTQDMSERIRNAKILVY